jgi:Sel1 repeat
MSPDNQKEYGRVFARARAGVAVAGFLALNACAPTPGPGQVATRVIPPPGKNQFLVENDEAACMRISNLDVRIYAACMQQRGYYVQMVGPGGVPMSVAQLSYPSRTTTLPTATANQSNSQLPPSASPAEISSDTQYNASSIKSIKDDFEQAEAADNSKNYVEAVQRWTELTTPAKYRLRLHPPLYSREEFQEMSEWKNLHSIAMYKLGYHYELGLGVRQDFKQAVYWYRIAITTISLPYPQPDPAIQKMLDSATERLVIIHAYGLGVPKSPENAYAATNMLSMGHYSNQPLQDKLRELLAANRLPRNADEIDAAYARLEQEKAQQEAKDEAQAAHEAKIAAAEAAKRRAAWLATPLATRRNQCSDRCEGEEQQCHSDNFNRGALAVGIMGFNKGMLAGGMVAQDCSGVYYSCVNSCVGGN